MPRIKIIGVGNEFRRDDAVGLLVARAVHERIGDGPEVVEAEETGPGLLDLMAGAEAAILVDAVRSGRPVGSICRLDCSCQVLPASARTTSTHGMTLAAWLELGRTLGVLPPTVVLYGIEVGALEPGVGLSPPVARALPTAAAQILEEVRSLCHA